MPNARGGRARWLVRTVVSSSEALPKHRTRDQASVSPRKHGFFFSSSRYALHSMCVRLEQELRVMRTFGAAGECAGQTGRATQLVGFRAFSDSAKRRVFAAGSCSRC